MTNEHPISVAIVGSGPSGLYAADALLRQKPDATIHIYERLPIPFGLVRSGVAPDHPGTKTVVRQFEKLMERPNVRFIGNVAVGDDIPLANLRDTYDLVFIAIGTACDRRLGIPGEGLQGIYGSGAFTSWYNGHPDHAALDPVVGRRIAIVGMGNVALDIARIIAQGPDALALTDISSSALAILRESRTEHITLFARGMPESASFSSSELNGLAALPRSSLTVDGDIPRRHDDPVTEKRLEALRAVQASDGAVSIHLAFGRMPLAIEGDGRVERLLLRRAQDGGCETGLFDTIITAIGFEVSAIPDLPICDNHVACDDDGRVLPGLYALGWAKRGPSGTIPTNRQEAQKVVRQALGNMRQSVGNDPNLALGHLATAGCPIVDWDGWKRIDAHELRNGTREKLLTRDAFLRIAQGTLLT